MMGRRPFIATAGVILAAALQAAMAQPAERVYRLGILHPGTLVSSDPFIANAFSNPLRELGYVEGQNLIIERKYADGDFDRLPGLALELVRRRVDVILAVGSPGVRAAKATMGWTRYPETVTSDAGSSPTTRTPA